MRNPSEVLLPSSGSAFFSRGNSLFVLGLYRATRGYSRSKKRLSKFLFPGCRHLQNIA